MEKTLFAMTGTFFFGIDDSLATLEALERFGRLFRETPVHLHLFYAQPESSLFDPGAILPITPDTGPFREWMVIRCAFMMAGSIPPTRRT